MTFYLNLAVTGVLQGLLIALAGLAVSLCFAVARFPNAATGDFMTLAAYVGVAGQAVTGSLLAGAAMRSWPWRCSRSRPTRSCSAG